MYYYKIVKDFIKKITYGYKYLLITAQINSYPANNEFKTDIYFLNGYSYST